MNTKKYFFAVDLGATSGRTIIGKLSKGHLELQELTRFENHLIPMGKHIYWDLYALFFEVIAGLRRAASLHVPIESIGVDTWGCDFVCVGDDEQVVANPVAYRDTYTKGTMDVFFREAMPREEVYKKTGIQFMDFNSLFQLYQLRREGNVALRNARRILFVPDALTYLLTGKAVCESTVASTSQLLNPYTHDLDEDLLKVLGLRRDQFGPMVSPGTVVGSLTHQMQRLTGLPAIPVVAVAGHDTASAVAAVPATDSHFAYLSSGTWSLMGIETKDAIINKESLQLNFTNEGGIENTTRFLKNICGMWIYECCRREWKEKIVAESAGRSESGEDRLKDLSHAVLQLKAMKQPAFRSIINPDDPSFANPSSMQQAIDDYCRRTGQPVPETPAAYCRCIFESLALRYRQVFGWLRRFAPVDLNVLHVIGGGSMNEYLDQFTSNACGIPVLAGPQEATAIGNIMLQAKAAGVVSDIWEMRSVVASSVSPKRFEPTDRDSWNAAYDSYLAKTSQKELPM
ncbi:MAG: rhamnulokinase [Prevotella sp.]|jgi:rhamnulokinase